ncbi:MAG TPA: hypothetical protein VF166_09465 [Gemmatimonadaceae bacterium]
MPMRRRSCRTPSISMSALSLLAVALSALNADAQERTPRSVTVVGGIYQFSTEPGVLGEVVGVRMDVPAGRFVVLEPGVMSLVRRVEGAWRFAVVPEVQVQAQAPLGAGVRPYFGVGAGPVLGLSSNDGVEGAAIALSASAGLRARLSDEWDGRVELRVHAIDIILPVAE